MRPDTSANAPIRSGEQERRRHERLDLGFKVRCRRLTPAEARQAARLLATDYTQPLRDADGLAYVVRGTDLSLEGLGVSGAYELMKAGPFATGAFLDLELETPHLGFTVRAVGRVLWTRWRPGAGEGRAGIAFLEVDAGDLARVEAAHTPG